mgnify:CR=1 FL=1
MSQNILLGYEIPTGEPVTIPLHHLVVCGLTGLSGKTTALEALISRAPEGYRALTFRTKRGELAFAGAHQVPPFYHQQADWRYVESLLEATMKERLKFERSWLIHACKGATSLRQVQDNIKKALTGKKLRGLDESVYTNLDAYFDLVLPELERIPLTQELHLGPGANVMDLVGISEEVQALIIRATLHALWTGERDVIVVIPEAWLFLPQGRGNPVKDVASRLIREGRSVGIYVWLDSQDVTNVEKSILKNVDIWILGRQRELNEVERTLNQLPAVVKKPRPEEVMTLPLGHFFVAAADFLKRVYVQPKWLDAETARRIALGEVQVETVIPEKEKEDDPMLQERVRELEAEVKRLKQALEEAKRAVRDPGAEQELAKVTGQLEAAREVSRGLSAHLRQLEELRTRYSSLAEGLELLRRGFAQLGLGAGAPISHIDIIQDLAADINQVLPIDVGLIDEDTQIIQLLSIRLQGGQTIQLKAPEALKAHYQRETVDKLGRVIEALEPEQREILRFLMAVGKATRAELAAKVTGLGDKRFEGQRVARWHQQHITPLANFHLVSWQARSSEVFYTLPDAVRAEMAIFSPTEEEVQAAGESLEHLLAKEGK